MSFLTVNQAAELIGMTPAFIYRLVSDKKLPAYKFGGSVRIDKDDFDKWIESRKLKIKTRKTLPS